MVIYSATVRNDEVDEFLTPPKLIEAIVSHLPYGKDDTFKMLDPGANLGQWGSVVKSHFSNAQITGVEILAGIEPPVAYAHWHNPVDFLEWETEQRFDLVLSNPPYSHPKKNMAELFVRRSYELVKPGGLLYFLLRTNFGNAKGRSRGLFKTHPLKHFIFLDRPSFYNHDSRTEQFGTKKTNRHDYALYIWQKGVNDPQPVDWLLWNE